MSVVGKNLRLSPLLDNPPLLVKATQVSVIIKVNILKKETNLEMQEPKSKFNRSLEDKILLD